MQTEDFDIVGSYNNQRFPNIDAERSINLFEYIDPLGKKPKTLITTSGLLNTELPFTGAGGFRNQFVFNNVAYSVVGSGVWRLSSAFILSKIGNLNTTAGYVGIDANTYQVIFVDGVDGWIWDTNANTFAMITDPYFPVSPVDCCQLDGFFVISAGGTNTFVLSELNQGMVYGSTSQTFTADDSANNWLIISSTASLATGVPFTVSTTGTLPSPLNNTTTYYSIVVDNTHIRVASSYQNAIMNIPIVLTGNGTPTNTIVNTGQFQQGAMTSHPGTIVGCRTLHRRLLLFSQFFTEVWENAGIGSNLPFRRNNSLLMEFGTPALGSIATGFDRMFFLSQTRDGLGPVMGVSGTESQPVSTKALDYALSQYASTPGQGVSDGRGFMVRENGIIFYRLNFTAANHTYVFNVSMSDPQNLRWHEEEVLNGDRHPAQTHIYFNGNNYVGHYSLPILYELDDTFYTNDGEAIRRARISKAFTPPGYQRRRIDRLQLDLVQGIVALLDQGEQPLYLFTQDLQLLLTQDGHEIQLQQGLSNNLNPDVPFVFVSISKDGGNSYGNKIKIPMGTLGNRTFRTVIRKLGVTPRGQGFVVMIEFFDAVPFIVLGASWAYEVLPE